MGIKKKTNCRWCDEKRPFMPGSNNQQHIPLFGGNDEHSGTMCLNSSIYTKENSDAKRIKTNLAQSLQENYIRGCIDGLVTLQQVLKNEESEGIILTSKRLGETIQELKWTFQKKARNKFSKNF